METFHKNESKYVFITITCACPLQFDEKEVNDHIKEKKKTKEKITHYALHILSLYSM